MAKATVLSASVRKRLKLLPGKARQRIDPKTGNIYSRRQFEKGRTRAPRQNVHKIRSRYRQYLQIRDDYIAKKNQARKKPLGKRQAMNSDELKQLIKDLHSKDPQKKKRALEKTIRGDKVKDWTPYIKRWEKGNL